MGKEVLNKLIANISLGIICLSIFVVHPALGSKRPEIVMKTIFDKKATPSINKKENIIKIVLPKELERHIKKAVQKVSHSKSIGYERSMA